MNATIAIHRVSGFQARYRAYTVRVDGQAASKLRNGKTVELTVMPGRHQVQLTVDWLWTSPILELDIAPDEHVRLVSRPKPILQGFWASRVDPKRYLGLEYSDQAR